MIRAIDITTQAVVQLRVPTAQFFAHIADTANGSHEASQEQFRLELSWPRLKLKIREASADQAVYDQLAKEYGLVHADRIQLSPVYHELACGPRVCKSASLNRVRIAIVFAPETQGVEMAYVYPVHEPALELLSTQFIRRQLSHTVEFCYVPSEGFRATPERLAIHEYQAGRLLPGPDLVRGGAGERLGSILGRIKTNALTRTAHN